MSSTSRGGWRPGHLALGASLALLAHAAFSAVHFAALAAGRYGEAARALRALPRDVLAELALALALALASVLLFSESLLPLDAGAESALNSLHRQLAPRADLVAASALGLEREGAAEAKAGAEKMLAEVLRERRARARAKELEAAAEAAEAGSAVGARRRAQEPEEGDEDGGEDGEEEGEEEEEEGADEAPEDVD